MSGPPGSGKSSIARRLAENSPYERAVHMHTDDFYQYIRKGYVSTWLPEAQDQNIIVCEAFTASAARYAIGGYEVIVDGIIGPWYLEPWIKTVKDGFDIRFIVLRPNKETTIARALERQRAGVLVTPDVVGNMWHYFSGLEHYEEYVIDTSTQTIDESAIAIRKLLTGGEMRLK
ncbi:MAG: AAA family ATPase [Syntrophomonas sp.]